MRTILAPLQLQGVDTPLVESLMSFANRLADAHQVSPKQLAKVLCNDSVYLRVDHAPRMSNIDLYPLVFCAHSRRTEVLVQRLERLTGAVHLAHGTLLRLRHTLSHNQSGACVQRRRWCPICYAEHEDVDAEPLAWWIPQITHCPVHDTRLIDRCIGCGSYQRDSRIGLSRKICGKCGSSLKYHDAKSDVRTPWALWCQTEMLKVLGHIATIDSEEISPDAVATFVRKVVPIASTKNYRSPVEHELRKLRSQGNRWSTIFEIAARWGTTPLDILLRPDEAVSPSLFNDKIKTPASPRRTPFDRHRYHLCKRTLHKLLRLPDQATLPALKHVLFDHKVSISGFYSNYPELCASYTRERRRRRKRHNDKKFDLAFDYIEVLIKQSRDAGEKLHRVKTIAQTMRDTDVSKAVARSALRVALAKLIARREASIKRTNSR